MKEIPSSLAHDIHIVPSSIVHAGFGIGRYDSPAPIHLPSPLSRQSVIAILVRGTVLRSPIRGSGAFRLTVVSAALLLSHDGLQKGVSELLSGRN